jgi:hypothetical protein
VLECLPIHLCKILLSDIDILPTRSQWPLLSLQAYGPPESPYKVCIYINTEAGIDCIAIAL